jgi:hypothetical protein
VSEITSQRRSRAVEVHAPSEAAPDDDLRAQDGNWPRFRWERDPGVRVRPGSFSYLRDGLYRQRQPIHPHSLVRSSQHRARGQRRVAPRQDVAIRPPEQIETIG